MAADPSMDAFFDTERKLNRWGAWSKQAAERLGYPRSTSIARLIEMVKVFEQQQKGVKRKALKRKQASDGDDESAGETAKGPGTRTIRRPDIGPVSGEIMSIDATVARLPGWMQDVIIRSYKFGQPDKDAASDMRIPKSTYRLRREAAVLQVSEMLAQRTSSR